MRAAPPIRAAAAGPALGLPLTAPVPPVRVDPRIWARRIAVRRLEGRRRLRRLLWLGGAVVVVVAGLGSTRTPLLDVDHIEIIGSTSDAPLRDALADAGLQPGRALVDVDLGGAEEVLLALPSVAEVRVERVWPGTVEVDVVERAPVAVVSVAGGEALVAADGIVVDVLALDPVAAGPATAGLARIEGTSSLAAGDQFEAGDLLAVAAALPDPIRSMVAAIGPGESSGEVELRLAGGGTVRIGATDQLDAKLVAAVTVLTQVDARCLAVLDVRVPSVATVTRAAGC